MYELLCKVRSPFVIAALVIRLVENGLVLTLLLQYPRLLSSAIVFTNG